MELPDLTTLQGLKDFIDRENMHPSQVESALTEGGSENPTITPESVLERAIKSYFPGEVYARRIRMLLSTNPEDADPDLSLIKLAEHISPEDFLTMMGEAFPGYVFAHNPASVEKHPKDSWFSLLVEAIYNSEGPGGVSQILHHLIKRLGKGKRDVLLGILKTKYTDLPESSEGVETSSARSESSADPEIQKAQVLLAVSEGTEMSEITNIPGSVQAAVQKVLASVDSDTPRVEVPAGFAARLEATEQAKAKQIISMVLSEANRFNRFQEIDVDIRDRRLLTERALAVAQQELQSQGYAIKKVQRGGYSNDDSLEVTEIGERLQARDRKQAEAIIKLVTDSIIKDDFRPETPERTSEKALQIALSSLREAPELKGYDFEVTTRGGYTAGNVITINRPKAKEQPVPPTKIETMVESLDATSVRLLEEMMIDRKLIGFATKNGQVEQKKTLDLLNRILEQRDLFSNPVFGAYAEQLRENVENPPLGVPFYRAYSRNLPDLLG
ncbi:hypothetical protein ACFL2V_11310 [Pseudomonadota bacterium]